MRPARIATPAAGGGWTFICEGLNGPAEGRGEGTGACARARVHKAPLYKTMLHAAMADGKRNEEGLGITISSHWSYARGRAVASITWDRAVPNTRARLRFEFREEALRVLTVHHVFECGR